MRRFIDVSFYVSKVIILFFFGGTAYYSLELLFRGRSHFSMIICGGACFCAIYVIKKYLTTVPLYLRAVLCSMAITSLELLTGIIVNVGLGLNVWDYSGRMFNFMGQICFEFSSLWLLVSVPTMWLCGVMEKYIFGGRGETGDAG